MPFRIDVLDAALTPERQAALADVLVRVGVEPEAAVLAAMVTPGPVVDVEAADVCDAVTAALTAAGFSVDAAESAQTPGERTAVRPAGRGTAWLAAGLALVVVLLVGVLIGSRTRPPAEPPPVAVAETPPGAGALPPAEPDPLPEPVRAAVDEPSGWTTGPVALPGERGATATLRAIRTGHHPGFDRVVFEFDGAVLPPVRIEPVGTSFTVCESDASFDVHGTAALAVTVRASSNRNTGRTDTEAHLPSVRDVVEVCGVGLGLDLVQAIGLSGPQPYRTQVLLNPLRLVVDVQA